MNDNDEDYKGHRISIKVDEDAESPRTWDNLGRMVCGHSKYSLGDAHIQDLDNGRHFNSPDEIVEFLIRECGAKVILPLFLYDHSGITMNTTGFNCNWDSGRVGFIYATAEKIREEYSIKRIGRLIKKKVHATVFIFVVFMSTSVMNYKS